MKESLGVLLSNFQKYFDYRFFYINVLSRGTPCIEDILLTKFRSLPTLCRITHTENAVMVTQVLNRQGKPKTLLKLCSLILTLIFFIFLLHPPASSILFITTLYETERKQ